MPKKIIISILCFGGFSIVSISQKLPEIIKQTYTDSLNRYYHNMHLPAYFFIGTSADNNPSQQSQSGNQVKNTQLPFYFKTEGRNIIHLYENEKNKEIVADYVVYVDGKAPKSNLTINAASKFTTKDKVYFGKGATIKIAVKDDISGVDKTYISLNGEDFKQWLGEIVLNEEGDYFLKYFSCDRVGNIEKVKTINLSIDFTPPKSRLKVIGLADGNIISAKTKLQLVAEENLLSIGKTYYKIDNGTRLASADGNIPITQLQDGNHHLEYFTEDNTNGRESVQFFDFYLDKNSPIVITDVLGDRFIVNEKIYFSGRTKLKFTAVDNKSGVEDIFYSLDGKAFTKYSDPFYMPTKAGVYAIRYYAFDKMGNQGAGNPNKKIEEYKHNGGVIYVDLTGPTLKNEFIGHYYKKDGQTYISSKTLIKFSGQDPESGLQKITFRFDSLLDETTYSLPFSLPKENYGKVDFYGYDNVNNRNVGRLNLQIDNDAPEINYSFNLSSTGNKNGVDIYPSGVAINLSTSDSKTGVSFSMYSINGEPEKLLKSTISGFEKNKLYKIKIRSVDHLANKAIVEIVFKTF